MILLLPVVLISCRKEFLDKKPDSTLQIPETLSELGLLLDNDRVINETPSLGEISSDNFYLNQNFWAAGITIKEKNGYVWAKNVYEGTTGVGDYDRPYTQVYYANVVIEALNKLNKSDSVVEWNDLMGRALFIRAYAFHNLVQIFSPVYDGNNENEMGVALRLRSDITIPSARATLKQTYDQIIKDLIASVPLFEKNIQSNYTIRPSKAAAYALLSRVYLSMGKYTEALKYADSCLSLHSYLLPYDSVNSFSYNPEVLYQSRMISTTNAIRSQGVPCFVDSTLFNSYAANDRRRNLYFKTFTNPPTPNTSYSLNIFMFTGLATDEVYLIKAECLARTGNFNEGIDVLNVLLSKRFADTAFIPVTAVNQQDALEKILTERRKELVFRGLRWTDLKRLNKDGANITLKRKLGSIEYILTPNHPNYVLPLPPDANLPQNVRTDL